MTRYIAFLLGFLFCATAYAQQVSNPMTKDGKNAILPGTLDNLGLGITHAPRFGGLWIEPPISAAGDLTNMYVFRDANYSGGTHGTVNTLASFATTVRAGTVPHEWNLYAGLDNYSTIANANEPVAFYAQARKRSTGATWGGVSQVLDYSAAGPSGQAIGFEINVSATGADVSNNRVALEIYNNVVPGGTEPVNIKSDIALDGVFTVRTNAIEVMGAGANYWFNLLAPTASARYLYGINLGYGVCDTTLPGTPGAQFIGPNHQIDCLGNLIVSNEKTINAVAAVGANQGWLRLLSSSGANFIESGLTNTTGSGAELSIANYNATQTFLLTGPNGTMVGAGVRQGAGTLNVQTGYYIGAVAGVTCAAGTFAAATAVVTKGLVTKCN